MYYGYVTVTCRKSILPHCSSTSLHYIAYCSPFSLALAFSLWHIRGSHVKCVEDRVMSFMENSPMTMSPSNHLALYVECWVASGNFPSPPSSLLLPPEPLSRSGRALPGCNTYSCGDPAKTLAGSVYCALQSFLPPACLSQRRELLVVKSKFGATAVVRLPTESARGKQEVKTLWGG